MVVEWRAVTHMLTTTVLDAWEMAYAGGAEAQLGGLVGCRSDADSQFTSIRCGERLADFSETPSIGADGDGCENALAAAMAGVTRAR